MSEDASLVRIALIALAEQSSTDSHGEADGGDEESISGVSENEEDLQEDCGDGDAKKRKAGTQTRRRLANKHATAFSTVHITPRSLEQCQAIDWEAEVNSERSFVGKPQVQLLMCEHTEANGASYLCYGAVHPGSNVRPCNTEYVITGVCGSPTCAFTFTANRDKKTATKCWRFTCFVPHSRGCGPIPLAPTLLPPPPQRLPLGPPPPPSPRRSLRHSADSDSDGAAATVDAPDSEPPAAAPSPSAVVQKLKHCTAFSATHLGAILVKARRDTRIKISTDAARMALSTFLYAPASAATLSRAIQAAKKFILGVPDVNFLVRIIFNHSLSLCICHVSLVPSPRP
jgi:hypothetical protein